MILSLLEIYPQPGRRKEIVDILLTGEVLIRLKPGCLCCELTGSLDDDKIVYFEKWSTVEDFQRHLCSDDYFNILNALEFASSPPRVSFFEVHNEKGMEVIEQVREGGGLQYE